MTIANGATFAVANGGFETRFERHFAHPVDRVWAALTEPDQLKSWFAELDGSLAPGADFRFTWSHGNTLDGVVTEYDPPRVFAWTWHKDRDPQSIVRWELTPEAAGTLFVLTHTLPGASADDATDTLGGWHEHLDMLGDALDGAPRAWSNENWSAFKQQYATQVEASEKTLV